MNATHLGWLGIFRLGLVQTSLGAIVVLTTSTINRVLVVELALPAMVPGALVALHYAVQILRPRLGHGSDVSGRRVRWIIGGMIVLAAGGLLSAVATAVAAGDVPAGMAMAAVAFALIGVGVGTSGTTLLVLMAKRTPERHRAAAASIVWVMMIAGFVVTATTAGHFLDPFSYERLIGVTATVCAIALVVTVLALWRVEDSADAPADGGRAPAIRFAAAWAEVRKEPRTLRFTCFVFVSMLAYSMQDLVLEPFAGTVFGMTPGQSTKLAGLQHGGVLIGMMLIALAVSGAGQRRLGSLLGWTIGGCIASGCALFAVAFSGPIGNAFLLQVAVFALGLSNGAFAAAAIGSMMNLVGSSGRSGREGLRMGLWGAAQAIAFGLGGFLGTVAVDLSRWLIASPTFAYLIVFAGEGLLFLGSAVLAASIDRGPDRTSDIEIAENYLREPSRG